MVMTKPRVYGYIDFRYIIYIIICIINLVQMANIIHNKQHYSVKPSAKKVVQDNSNHAITFHFNYRKITLIGRLHLLAPAHQYLEHGSLASESPTARLVWCMHVVDEGAGVFPYS